MSLYELFSTIGALERRMEEQKNAENGGGAPSRPLNEAELEKMRAAWRATGATDIKV